MPSGSKRPDHLQLGEEYGVYTKGLGETQIQVLRALRDHGYWCEWPQCGWHWDTETNTKRILDSLVKRGLAAKGEYRKYYPNPANRPQPCWGAYKDSYMVTMGGYFFLMEWETLNFGPPRRR